MKYRGLVGAVLLLPVLFLAFVAAIAAWDPIGVLWRSEPKVWAMGIRVMAVCAIDSGKYDSYVLGTSMLKNSPAREFEKVFPGSHFANISMKGSNFYERFFPMQHLLVDNKVKRIVYSLDAEYIVECTEGSEYGDVRFLYDNIRINNIDIYFNLKTLEDIVNGYRKKKTKQFYINHDDYNMPDAWENGWDDDRYGYENWVRIAIAEKMSGDIGKYINELISFRHKIIDDEFNEEKLLEKYSKDINASIQYCEDYILKIIREHKNVDFYMILPPYSVIEFAKWYQTDRKYAVIHREVVRYFAKMADYIENLHVFGYEGEEFTKEISIYRDTIHYHPAINSRIVKDISQNRRKLSSDNVEAYLEKGKQAALDFDLRGFAQKVEDCLERKRKE